MPSPENRYVWTWRIIESAVVLLLLGSLIAMAMWLDGRSGFTTLLESSRDHVALVLIIAFPLLAIGLPPSLFAMACGAMLPIGVATPVGIFISTLGGLMPYWLGRAFHSKTIDPRLIRRMELTADLIRNADWRGVALLRLLPLLPYPLMNYVFGRLGTASRSFTLGTIIGLIPGLFLYSLLGRLGHLVLQGEQANWVALILLGLSLLALIILGGHLLQRLRRHHQSTQASIRS